MQRKIRPRCIGTEGDDPCAESRKLIAEVDYRPIVLRLIFKNPDLRRVVLVHGRIAIEMVGSKVQPDRRMRAKALDGLELERRDLEHHDVQLTALLNSCGKSRA